MLRRVLSAFTVLALLLITTSSALAGGNGARVERITFENDTETFTDVLFCASETPARITITASGFIQIVAKRNGTGRFLGVVRGTLTARVDGVTYTGRFHQQFGGDLSGTRVTGTLHITGTGSDGSRLRANLRFKLGDGMESVKIVCPGNQ